MVSVWVWIVILAIIALVLSGFVIRDYLNNDDADDSPELR